MCFHSIFAHRCNCCYLAQRSPASTGTSLCVREPLEGINRVSICVSKVGDRLSDGSGDDTATGLQTGIRWWSVSSNSSSSSSSSEPGVVKKLFITVLPLWVYYISKHWFIDSFYSFMLRHIIWPTTMEATPHPTNHVTGILPCQVRVKHTAESYHCLMEPVVWAPPTTREKKTKEFSES